MLSAVDHALLWLRAFALRLKGVVRRLWQVGSPAELFTVGWLLLLVIIGVPSAITGQGDWNEPAVLALALVAYLDLLNDATRVRVNVWMLAREKPSGAPAAVVVPCSLADGQHRLAYTGGAWQEIK